MPLWLWITLWVTAPYLLMLPWQVHALPRVSKIARLQPLIGFPHLYPRVPNVGAFLDISIPLQRPHRKGMPFLRSRRTKAGAVRILTRAMVTTPRPKPITKCRRLDTTKTSCRALAVDIMRSTTPLQRTVNKA